MSERLERVAALYVETGGVYYGLEGVDPWDEERDARKYAGPWPVVAHPPCERWGEQWHACRPAGHPKRGVLGADGGCFESALRKVGHFGGVVEHPASSRAWKWFDLPVPNPDGGWRPELSVDFGPRIHTAGFGWSCFVDQGHYGYPVRKETLLYFVGHDRPPSLTWGPSDKPKMDRRPSRRRHGEPGGAIGYDRGGKRSATPPAFRDLLLAIARSAAHGLEEPSTETAAASGTTRRTPQKERA